MLIGLMQPAWAVKQVNWQDLIDPVAADFDDPFAALGLAELRSLGTVLRLRKLLADPGLESDARADAADRLDREEAKLAVPQGSTRTGSCPAGRKSAASARKR